MTENVKQDQESHALSDMEKARIADIVKKKFKSLQVSDVMVTLEPNVRKRVEALKDIQKEFDQSEENFLKERAELDAKYQKIYEPLYAKRSDIVNGVVEVDGLSTKSSDDKTAEDVKGVPEFWLTAMKTNEILAEEIQERDEDALKYLKDIKWCKTDDPKGFKLEFFFNPNPYFKNSVLAKIYHMIDEDEPVLEKAIGTEIEWYPGKNLTQKLLKKKPKKGAKNAKPITKVEDCESFFNFFNPPQIPEDEEDLDDDTAEQLQNQMEEDYDIGSTIRDKIIPHAVSWYTGEAAQEDVSELGDEEDDEEQEEEEENEDKEKDEDEDDEDEDEDEEDEDDDGDNEQEERNTTKKKVGARAMDGKLGDQPPECKQQ